MDNFKSFRSYSSQAGEWKSSVEDEEGMFAEALLSAAIEMNAPVWRVYEAWSHMQRYPEFIARLQSVAPVSPGCYRWEAKSVEDHRVECLAEITEEVPNTRISWILRAGRAVQPCEVLMEALSPLRTRVTMQVGCLQGECDASSGAEWYPFPDGEKSIRQDLESFKAALEKETTLTRSASTLTPDQPV